MTNSISEDMEIPEDFSFESSNASEATTKTDKGQIEEQPFRRDDDEPRAGRSKMAKVGIGIGLVAIVGGGAAWGVLHESDKALSPLGKLEPHSSSPMIVADAPSHSAVSIDERGNVSINGAEDGLSSAMLKGYVSWQDLNDFRKGFEAISQEEYRLLYKEVFSNSDALKNLKAAGSDTDNTAEVAVLRAKLESLQSAVDTQLQGQQEIATRLGKVEKNMGWHYNMIRSLQGNPVAKPARDNALGDARRQPVSAAKSESAKNELIIIDGFRLAGIGPYRAHILEGNSKKARAVTVGSFINGAGKVVSFDTKGRRIITTDGIIQ